MRALPPIDDNPLDSPEFLDRAVAGWKAETVRTDAWGYAGRTRRGLLDDMIDALPAAQQSDIRIRFSPDYPSGNGKAAERALFDALTAAQLDAAGPVNIPLTPEALEAEVLRRRRAELDEAETLLGIDGPGVGGVLGTFARAATDQTSLAMVPFGLGGSIARVIASEAALGALGEAAILPREVRVAGELDIPAPTAGDMALRIGLGAVAGGTFGGVIAGAPRAYAYLRNRRSSGSEARPDGANPVDHEDDIAAAEDRLRRDQPFDDPAATTRPSMTPGATTEEPADAAIIDAIIGVESGGNAAARNPNSSALGLGQMIESTWLSLIQRHRPDLAEGRSRGQLLDLRRDGSLSREMTTRLMEDNRAALRAAGQPADPGSLYLAHFLGVQGAIGALRAPLDAPIGRLMSTAAIRANRGVTYNGKALRNFTAADLRGWARQKMRRTYLPGAGSDAPSSGPTSRGFTRPGQISTGTGTRIDVDYEVIDASALRPATGALQPRDRSRASSDEQVAEIAARLDPARLMPSPEADRGAPIVGPDNVIESGNGRVMALQRAARLHPDRMAAYREAITEAGFEIPEGMETPVLVARRRTEMDDTARQRFIREANTSTIARMSATERAASDAAGLPEDTVRMYVPGEAMNSRANRPFVQRALDALPQTERAGLVDGDGALNQEGILRLRQAMFARAYDAPDILARFTETDAGELRSLIEALDEAAPGWAALRADIAAGRVRPEMDITPHVLDAMRLIAQARALAARQGGTVASAVAELVDSVDLLEGALSPLTAALVRKFWTGGKAAPKDKVADFLNRYAAEARKIGTTDASLFGDLPGPLEALRAIDPEGFGDVTEIGRAMPQPATVDRTPLPAGAYADGAASPEAQAAAEIGLDDLRGQPDAPAPVERTSAAPAEVFATEEEYLQLEDISMPIDASLPKDGQRAQVRALTEENVRFVKSLISDIDARFGTRSGDNVKALSKVTQKAERPSLIEKKPWHTVAHLRDSYRFKTVINDIRDVPAIFQLALDRGVSVIKIDTKKLFEPKDFGWRIVAFDLRMPNGQIVEWYLPIAELEKAKKDIGHKIFEKWRNKSSDELVANYSEYQTDMAESYRLYEQALTDALARSGLTVQDAKAAWTSAESSLRSSALSSVSVRQSSISSGMMMSSRPRRGAESQAPSSPRSRWPSGDQSIARLVPSSTSAQVSAIENTPFNPEISTPAASRNGDMAADATPPADPRRNVEMVARDIEDLTFTDETGATVRLGDYLRDLDDAQAAQAVVDACTLGAR